jgi:hypothetical protein
VASRFLGSNSQRATQAENRNGHGLESEALQLSGFVAARSVVQSHRFLRFMPRASGAFLALFLPFSSAAAMLIFIVCDGLSIALPPNETTMKCRMDDTLKFWVDVAYERKKWEHPNRTKRQLITEILRKFEQRGDAMRHLNSKGKIAWRPSPAMLMELADAERDARDDLEDFP